MAVLGMRQVALSNYHYVGYSFSYFLRSMRTFSVGQIELYAAAPHLSVLDASNGDIVSMAKNIRTEGLRVCCVTQEQCIYPINIASRDPALRRRSIQSFLRCIEIADMMEAPKVLVTPGRSAFDESREEAWKRSADALAVLSEQAGKYGIQMVLEGVTHLSTNLVTTADEIIAMLDTVRHPALTSMMDICVLAREGLDPEEYVKKLGTRMQHLHISDFSNGARYALGKGSLPLLGLFALLESTQYSGLLALEIMNHIYDADPISCTEQCVAFLRKHLHADCG